MRHSRGHGLETASDEVMAITRGPHFRCPKCGELGRETEDHSRPEFDRLSADEIRSMQQFSKFAPGKFDGGLRLGDKPAVRKEATRLGRKPSLEILLRTGRSVYSRSRRRRKIV